METSRIIFKDLPRTLTEAGFRNHLALLKDCEVTDIKLIPTRRLGFVGYNSPEDALKAVRYFHRSYIRMSKVTVELARPITDHSEPAQPRPQNISGELSTSNAIVRERKPALGEAGAAKKRKRVDLDEERQELRKFLDVMGPKNKEKPGGDIEGEALPLAAASDTSGDEYGDIPSKQKKRLVVDRGVKSPLLDPAATNDDGSATLIATSPRPVARQANATDDEWVRERTSRLLDILGPDEQAGGGGAPKLDEDMVSVTHSMTEGSTNHYDSSPRGQEEDAPVDDNEEETKIRETSRLFVRNLRFSTSEDDLRERFEQFGPLKEVKLPLAEPGKNKGIAFIGFADAASAIDAFRNVDGKPLQGRIVHVLAATAKKTRKLDEVAISKLPPKQQKFARQKVKRDMETSKWNSLFMSQEDANASTADRLGVSKSELLDPTSADAAVKQAIAETTVIQETKEYFAQNGVNLEAFRWRKRGGTAILVKQFGYGTTLQELRKLFEEFGPVIQVLMPPSGTIALVQFAQADHAAAAYTGLVYRRHKAAALLLEKGPEDLFASQTLESLQPQSSSPAGVEKLSGAELLEPDAQTDQVGSVALYVKNLNFTTRSEDLKVAFERRKGFLFAQVKTKPDPKKQGHVLSMGFGFVHFRTREDATAAQSALDGMVLQSHTLKIRVSHRGQDAAGERKRDDQAKKDAAQGTKIIIRNIAFEATKKDVRALVGHYGQLRALRFPRSLVGNIMRGRGFAFAEFTTPKEAESAIKELEHTHLLGRRLKIEYAEGDAQDAEEEIAKMQDKVQGQVSKVRLQQLTGRDKKEKVNIGGDGDEAEA